MSLVLSVVVLLLGLPLPAHGAPGSLRPAQSPCPSKLAEEDEQCDKRWGFDLEPSFSIPNTIPTSQKR